MIKQNFHTHTQRCGHAFGKDEDYVTCAIKAKVEVLGFSDHAAYPVSNKNERMDLSEVEEYITSIRNLTDRYKDQVTIYTGMEVEYYPSQWEVLKQYRQTMDYLILGQHNLELDINSSYELMTPQELNQYTDCLEEACRHSLVEYIAHPDVCLWSYPKIDDSVRTIARRIADISNRYQIPLEINCGSGVRDYGYRKYEDGSRYAYPVREVFKVFAEEKCPVIIGMDIHSPEHFLTDEYLNRALKVLEGLDLNILDRFDIIAEAEKHKKIFY